MTYVIEETDSTILGQLYYVTWMNLNPCILLENKTLTENTQYGDGGVEWYTSV